MCVGPPLVGEGYAAPLRWALAGPAGPALPCAAALPQRQPPSCFGSGPVGAGQAGSGSAPLRTAPLWHLHGGTAREAASPARGPALVGVSRY